MFGAGAGVLGGYGVWFVAGLPFRPVGALVARGSGAGGGPGVGGG